MGGLTKAQGELLRAITYSDAHWQADFTKAHPKHVPTLLQFRDDGLVTFSADASRIRITPAGRAALTQKEPK